MGKLISELNSVSEINKTDQLVIYSPGGGNFKYICE